MSKEKNLSKGLLVGFLAGGIVGAVIALLYAPKSGKELRKDIKDKTNEWKDEAEKYISEAKDKAKELINEGKQKSDRIIFEAKAKTDEILKDAEKLFHDAKTKVGSTISAGKNIVEKESGDIKSAIKAGIDAYRETKNT
ncbi:MAG: YtxH domain-containing protein [Ignavibacteriaceae bacterium]|nr:YtxH domain-containing protein [Ignavibacteriaceae bacterium]